MRKPQKSRHPDKWSEIHVRIKGSLKNELIDYARRHELSVGQIVNYAIFLLLQDEKGIPAPGSPQYSLPTLEESLLAYMKGDTLLQPCGQVSCNMQLTELDGLSFCDTCNLRIL